MQTCVSPVYNEIPTESLMQAPVPSVKATPSRISNVGSVASLSASSAWPPGQSLEATATIIGELFPEEFPCEVPAERNGVGAAGPAHRTRIDHRAATLEVSAGYCFSELPQGILLQPTYGLPGGHAHISRGQAAFVGATHRSPTAWLQRLAANRHRRLRPACCRQDPPLPPQGDGACGLSRSSGSRSRSSSPASSTSEDQNLYAAALRAGFEDGPHEEVATEEPLAQMPVRMWLRSSHRAGDQPQRHLHHHGSSADPVRQLSTSAVLTHNESHLHAGRRHPLWSGDGLPLETPAAAWQVAEELGHAGGMAAPRYLLVRLGECIPAETGAAPVHRSRLETVPQWREFLNYGEGRDPRGSLALDELLTCPCCLTIYRQPIALPCGHSLCRCCFARISVQPAAMRRCPLCRTEIPQCDLRVNLALAAVCDSLRAFRALREATERGNVFQLNDKGRSPLRVEALDE